MNIYLEISKLINFGLKNNIIEESDVIFVRNQLMDILNLSDFEVCDCDKNFIETEVPDYPQEILDNILAYAVENKIIEDGITARDLFDTKIMGLMTPFPREILKNFNEIKKEKSIRAATYYYYNFSKKINYIRTDRIAKNINWKSKTEYGDLDITINLSKPEKDPKEIEREKTLKLDSNYPKCLLCYENVGYAGNFRHPARQNLRILPLTLGNEAWFMQYSPYVYYNEHSIVFCKEHRPMVINKDCIIRLLDYVDLFPHYFLGSNADLPIVGGSILSHDHYQGGGYDFAMAKADIETKIIFKDFEDVEAGIVKWPLSVIRIRSKEKNNLLLLSEKIMTAWQSYTDEASYIFAYTDDKRHNTITPVARRRGELFELDLVLRNNITTEERQLGLYHPRPAYHNIKRENIGVIEVMGLAVLPGRLKNEMNKIADFILNEKNYLEKISQDFDTEKHYEWFLKFKDDYTLNNLSKDELINNVLYNEIGKTFAKCLEDAGVYKRTDEGKKAFLKFIETINKN